MNENTPTTREEILEQRRRRNNELRQKFDKEHTRHFGFKLNRNTDAELIERLESQPAIQTYIKDLIREDIKRTKEEY